MGDVPGLEEIDAFYSRMFGFVPNGLRIMARRPEIVMGFLQLRRAVVDPATSEVPVEFKELIGHIASKTAGCRYCQAHTIFGAERAGVSAARLEAIWEYRNSAVFSAAERVALDLAVAASSVPNGVTDELMDSVKEHWDDGQIVEIMAMIAMYGFLNRWNDSLATPLEQASLDAAATALGAAGWHPGNHA
jgi:uncharacterized peroxidase-related enzyme